MEQESEQQGSMDGPEVIDRLEDLALSGREGYVGFFYQQRVKGKYSFMHTPRVSVFVNKSLSLCACRFQIDTRCLYDRVLISMTWFTVTVLCLRQILITWVSGVISIKFFLPVAELNHSPRGVW